MFKSSTLNPSNSNHLFFKFKNTYFLVFKNLLFYYFFLSSLLFLAAFFYMTIGSFSISYSNTFSTLANYFLLQEVKGEIANILINIRLPRLIMAILLGSSLGVCGLLLQSYVKNNFASPSMLGISDGAVTAVLICVILYPSLPILYYPLIGILGGMSVGIFMFLVYFFFLPTSLNLILIGIGLKSFLDSIATIFITYSEISLVSSALMWMTGSLHGIHLSQVYLIMPYVILLLLIAISLSKHLNIWVRGDNLPTFLGMNKRLFEVTLLLCVILLTSITTAFVGSINFVGFLVPHIARKFVGGNQFSLITLSALIGALLVLISDLIGRNIVMPLQIPVGIITMILGALFFIYLCFKKQTN